MNYAEAVASTASAKNQMQFQERMSNTAHVREVQDLKNAGLNPVLSAKLGGASTPSGAPGDYSDPETNAIAGALKTAQLSVGSSAKAMESLSNDIGDFLKETGDTFSNFFNNMDVELPKLIDFYQGKNEEWHLPSALRQALNNVNVDAAGILNRATGNRYARLFQNATGKYKNNGNGVGDVLDTLLSYTEEKSRPWRKFVLPFLTGGATAPLSFAKRSSAGFIGKTFNSAKSAISKLISRFKKK